MLPSQGYKSNTYDSIKLEGASQLSIGDTFSTTVSQQPATPLAVLKQFFYVLLPRTKAFAGRDQELARLTKSLEAGSRIVIAGLGGIGKSQIALEYCCRYREKRPTSYVWWIDAVNTTKIVQAYIDIADTLHIPISSKENLMKDIRNWFSQPENGHWLFVFDNVNDLEAITRHKIDGQTGSVLEYLPYSHLKGQIIITSATKEAADLVGAELIEVDTLPSSEARLLLRSYLPVPPDISTPEDLESLAVNLSCIPLALTQAARYIRQMNKTAKEYLHMINDSTQKALLLSKPLGLQNQYCEAQHTVFGVLNLSYVTLKHKHRLSFEILNMVCWLHRISIPDSILRRCCAGDGEKSEVEIDEAILPLMQYSFLEKQSRKSESDEVVYCMHSLVQSAVQIFQSRDGLQHNSKSEALKLVEQETMHPLRKHDWHRLKSWIPHVNSILGMSNSSQLMHYQSRSSLLLVLGVYSQNVLGQGDRAIEYLEDSLPDLKRPGYISMCVTFLATCYHGKPDGTVRAIELLRSTLKRPEFCSAPVEGAIRHEARFRCKLAELLCEALPPRLQEAQHEVSKASELLERFGTKGHPYEQLIPYMIMHCRGEIALVQAASSNSADGEDLLAGAEFQILDYHKRLQNIQTPSNVDNNRKAGILWLLGRVYMAQAASRQSKAEEEKLEAAELSFRTCYNFYTQNSGTLSVVSLKMLLELAQCLRKQRRYRDMAALLEFLRSSLEIEEQGKENIYFLQCIDLLSWVLLEQGEYQDAIDVCETFYPAMKKICGDGHHCTVDVRKRQLVLERHLTAKLNMDHLRYWI